MCTAITLQTNDNYFGRNLDFDFNYGQKIVFTPRNHPIPFRHMESQSKHYALIGMGIVAGEFPHYFDAMNEKGLGIAGLNFVGNAFYHPIDESKHNLAQFEIIPYILCTCSSVQEVKELLKNTNIDDETFSPQFPSSSLHWICADKNECIIIESMKDGLHVYENTIGVLTNNPPFDKQMELYSKYKDLTVKDPENSLEDDKTYYSRGVGALGLPGDLSSSSRFAKCAFTKLNSRSLSDEEHSVSQFFHVLHSVEQQDGLCEVKEGMFEITQYSDCYNLDKGYLYYTTYNNCSINKLIMNHLEFEDDKLTVYELNDSLSITEQN